ncbi:hypothetical protein B0T13DRAFT_244869 [Neurospora crassa]|nr:hypothetical protein B0T13DRAFT_244869 [Neurospora crassa]
MPRPETPSILHISNLVLMLHDYQTISKGCAKLMYLTGPGRVGKARTTPPSSFPPSLTKPRKTKVDTEWFPVRCPHFCKFNRGKSRLRGFDTGIVSDHPLTSSFVVQANDNYSVPRYYSSLPLYSRRGIHTLLHTKHAG